jgi:hypothetical protein
VSDFVVGDQVEVFAFRRWRPGRVLAIGRARIEVEYLVPKGARRKRVARFPSTRIRRRSP